MERIKNCQPIGTVTIANGASLSSALDFGEYRHPLIIWIPAWTGAKLTFQSSLDGVTWGELGDKDGLVEVASAAVDTSGAFVVLNPLTFKGVRWLKVRSGTKASAVNQAADRTLTLYGG